MATRSKGVEGKLCEAWRILRGEGHGPPSDGDGGKTRTSTETGRCAVEESEGGCNAPLPPRASTADPSQRRGAREASLRVDGRGGPFLCATRTKGGVATEGDVWPAIPRPPVEMLVCRLLSPMRVCICIAMHQRGSVGHGNWTIRKPHGGRCDQQLTLHRKATDPSTCCPDKAWVSWRVVHATKRPRPTHPRSFASPSSITSPFPGNFLRITSVWRFACHDRCSGSIFDGFLSLFRFEPEEKGVVRPFRWDRKGIVCTGMTCITQRITSCTTWDPVSPAPVAIGGWEGRRRGEEKLGLFGPSVPNSGIRRGGRSGGKNPRVSR